MTSRKKPESEPVTIDYDPEILRRFSELPLLINCKSTLTPKERARKEALAELDRLEAEARAMGWKPKSESAPTTKAKTGGRARKWEDFYTLACKVRQDDPRASWETIAAKYNRRYSTREHLDARRACEIFSRYQKREQNHD